MAVLRLFALIALPVALDTIYALVSKSAGIPYKAFIAPATLMYIAVGAGITWFSGSWIRGTAASALVSFSDVTLGWYVSVQIGSAKPAEDLLSTVVTILVVGVYQTALGMASAFITGLVRARLAR